MRREWIEGVLMTQPLLDELVPIELDLEERLDMVDHPCRIAWQTAEHPRRVLPPGTEVADVFDQMGVGRKLLIL